MNLRDVERDSIRRFVQQAASEGYLSGRVLDYGCGRQPYRDIVEAAGGEHFPFDREDFPGNVGGVSFAYPSREIGIDTILCTQVIQYVPNEYVGEGAEVDAHYESGPTSFLRGLQTFLYWSTKRWVTGNDGYLVMTYPTNWPEVEPEDLHRFTKAGMERLLIEAGFTIVTHERRAQIAVMIDESAVMALGYGVVARA